MPYWSAQAMHTGRPTDHSYPRVFTTYILGHDGLLPCAPSRRCGWPQANRLGQSSHTLRQTH